MRSTAALLSALLGCGSSTAADGGWADAASPDAGPAEAGAPDASAEILPPRAPQPPLPPMHAPWIEPPCPIGQWPEDPAAGPVLYVDPAAPAGGTGTSTAPLATIAEALARAAPDTVIALGKGVFREELTLGARARLQGACAAETVIEAAAITVGATVSFRDLTIAARVAARGSPIWISAEDVRFRGRIELREAAELSGDRIRLEGALFALEGDRTRARIVQLDAREVMIAVRLAASLELSDLSASNVTIAADLPGAAISIAEATISGGALSAIDGARLHLERAETGSTSVIARGRGATAELQDVKLEDVAAEALSASDGAELQLARVAIARASKRGLVSSGQGARVTVRDLSIAATASDQTDGTAGVAIAAVLGGAIEGARVALDANRAAGIEAEGGTVELRDVRVTATEPEVCGAIGCDSFGVGHGLLSGAQAIIVLERFELTGSAACGAAVLATGRIRLTEGVIAENRYARCVPDNWHELVETRVETRDNTGDTYEGPPLGHE